MPSTGLATRNQYGIRRVSEPSLRTTKPVTSASVAPAAAEAVTSSRPGTVTVEGTATETPAELPC